MERLLILIAAPLMLLNYFAGIVSFFLLIYLGNYQTAIFGLLLSAFGAFVCGLLLLPSFAASVPGAILVARQGFQKVVGLFLVLLGVLLTTAAILAWVGAVYYFFANQFMAGDPSLPYLLASYSVATGPWTYMATKEDNEYSLASVFFLQLGAAIGTGAIYFADINMVDAFLLLAGVMALGLVFQLFLAKAIAAESKKWVG